MGIVVHVQKFSTAIIQLCGLPKWNIAVYMYPLHQTHPYAPLPQVVLSRSMTNWTPLHQSLLTSIRFTLRTNGRGMWPAPRVSYLSFQSQTKRRNRQKDRFGYANLMKLFFFFKSLAIIFVNQAVPHRRGTLERSRKAQGYQLSRTLKGTSC